MTCDSCESEMTEDDRGTRMVFAGDYYSPPEYATTWITWRCPFCGDYKLETDPEE